MPNAKLLSTTQIHRQNSDVTQGRYQILSQPVKIFVAAAKHGTKGSRDLLTPRVRSRDASLRRDAYAARECAYDDGALLDRGSLDGYQTTTVVALSF